MAAQDADQGQAAHGNPVRGELRGGTEGGHVAQATAGLMGEGTPDIASPAGGVHDHMPAAPVRGTDVDPAAHHLAGGKSANDIGRFLQEVQFPTKKETVIRTAARRGAPNDVVRCLSDLPRTDYASFEELIRDYPRLEERSQG